MSMIGGAKKLILYHNAKKYYYHSIYMDISTINNETTFELEKSHLEIHIKIKQRSGKKYWTTVEGLDKVELPTNVTLDDISRKMKKAYNCGATIIKPENSIQLNGDHRDNIKNFLIKSKLVNEEQIKMHGF
jgi:translation initiation factor 1